MRTSQCDTTNDLSDISRVQNIVRDFFLTLAISEDSPRIVLAVSGGPDSICMADAIIALQSELHITPVIAHLNHCLRGQDAMDDADFVRSFAESHGIACRVAETDVQQLSIDRRLSIEEAARIARYTFLASVAREYKANHIALAHNADDQVETVLLRLIRGTGVAGLQGIHAISLLKNEFGSESAGFILLRPLLSLPRSAIETYCDLRQLSPRHDHTNDERHHLRNRVRLDLLPLLEQLNPGIRKVIWHLADTARSDMEIVDDATNQALDQLRLLNGEDISYDRLAWSALPVSLQRTTLRKALLRFNGDLTGVKYAGIEEARNVLNSSTSRAEIAILASARIVTTPQRFWFKQTTTDLL